MAFKRSKRILALGESVTLKFNGAANAEKARIDKYIKEHHITNKDDYRIVVLAAGELDSPTPDNVGQAAIRAIQSHAADRYTLVEGMKDLREAIAADVLADYGLKYSADPKENEIIVDVGAKHTLFNMLAATVDEGDVVVIRKPYWTSYPEMVKFFGGVPVYYDGSPEDLERVLSIHTNAKLVIENSPSNPDGQIDPKTELEKKAEVLRRYPDVNWASDDIYRPIVYSGKAWNILEVAPDLRERVVIINGVSKKSAMTGWRIGYAAGPKGLIADMKTVQSQSTSNPAAVSQFAALEALNNPGEFTQEAVDALRPRQEFVLSAFGSIPGFTAIKPEGAFYLYVHINGIIGRYYGETQITNDSVAAKSILAEAGVGLIPGEAGFGVGPAIRLSFAAPMDDLVLAHARTKAFVGNITDGPRPNGRVPRITVLVPAA